MPRVPGHSWRALQGGPGSRSGGRAKHGATHVRFDPLSLWWGSTPERASESSRDTGQMCVDACDLALIRVTSHMRTLCARKTDTSTVWAVVRERKVCAVRRAARAGTWHTPPNRHTSYSTPRRERWPLQQQRLRPVALPLFFDHVLNQTYTLTRPEAPHPRLHLRTHRASARFPSRRSGIPSRWPP